MASWTVLCGKANVAFRGRQFLRRFGLEKLAVRCRKLGVNPGGWQSKSLGSEAELTRAAVACLHLHYVPDNTGPPNAFNSGMSLTTSRLILRRWRDADLSEFARLNNDPSSMAKSRLRRF